jgi:hypothetical protein
VGQALLVAAWPGMRSGKWPFPANHQPHSGTRQSDDPNRGPYEDPYDQLADFVERVLEAMQEWSQSFSHLLAGERINGTRPTLD